jgi:hypothetical protein
VQKLSDKFDFDVDEIKNRTGLPIIGVKQLINPPSDPATAGDTQKKKPNANTRQILNYPFGEIKEGWTVQAATWDAAVEKLVNQIWEGKANAADLNRDLVLKYYAGLNKATQNGWGGGYYTDDLTRKFRENLLKFSGAKSYNLIAKMLEAKAGETSKEVFLSKAKALLNQHNEQWQQTEEKFASNSASSARDFQTYQKDADLYPNLKYRTMGDAEVRPEHAANEGVIKPIREWTKIPPLDYGCRCWLEQTTEKPNGRNISVFNDQVANNAAINGELFTNKNGYFQNISPIDQSAVKANTDLMKEYMPYNRQIKVGEHTIFINDFADLSDLQPNIDAAKLVADFLKKDIYIRPHINAAQGHPNPEFGIGTRNTLADLKTMEADSNNFFKNRISAANKQGCNYVVMNIDKYQGDATLLKDKITEGFLNKYKENKPHNLNIEKLVIIRDGRVIQLTRQQVEKGMFGNLEKLNAEK